MEQKEHDSKRPGRRNRRSRQKTFPINRALWVLGMATLLSGLMIQYQYHLRNSPGETTFFALNRPAWNTLHVWASLLFSGVVALHAWAHRKWYGNVWKRNFPAQQRPTVLLTALTFLVVVSGSIPLFMLYSGGNPTVRLSLIELHDKLAILFIIVVVCHSVKRFKGRGGLIKNGFR